MTDKITRPPKDNVFRAVYPAVELRDGADDDGPVLNGHFARFNEWTEIDSVWEGRFMERIDPGAARKTIAENRDAMRVLFQHGRDPQVGDKPLGPIRELREDDEGVYYEVPLLDTAYNRDLEPGLRAGLYGASFRFSVMKEEFDPKPKRSRHNPEGIPERTIKEMKVMEFGPVTFPAYAGATAGVRSLTDDMFFDQIAKDPDRLRALIERREGHSVDGIAVNVALPDDGAATEHSDEGSRSEPQAQPDPPPAVAATTHQDPPDGGSLSVREDNRVKTIEELRARKDEINARFTEIHAENGAEKLPEEVQSEWDGLLAERTDIEQRIDDYEARTAVLETVVREKPQNAVRVGQKPIVRGGTRTNVPGNVWDVAEYRNLNNTEESLKQAYRDGAMRAAEISVFPHERAEKSKAQERIEALLEKDDKHGTFAQRLLTTGSPVYARAFGKVLAAGDPVRAGLTSEEMRALSTTTTAGGFAVPFTLDPTIILTSDGQVNPLRAISRVETLVNSNTWQGVSTAGITVSRGSEASAVTDNSPTLAQPEVTATSVKTLIRFSIEIGQDWAGLQSEMARILQDAKDDEEAESFITGDGTGNNPGGVVATLAATSHVGSEGNGFGSDDLYRLEEALPPRFRSRGRFLANRAQYNRVRQLDTSGGADLWVRLGAGLPPELIGYPAHEASAMDSTIADGDEIMLFGDFRHFLIVDVAGMNVELVPHVVNGDGNLTGQRGIFAHWRNSSLVLADNAFRLLKAGVVTS